MHRVWNIIVLSFPPPIAHNPHHLTTLPCLPRAFLCKTTHSSPHLPPSFSTKQHHELSGGQGGRKEGVDHPGRLRRGRRRLRQGVQAPRLRDPRLRRCAGHHREDERGRHPLLPPGRVPRRPQPRDRAAFRAHAAHQGDPAPRHEVRLVDRAPGRQAHRAVNRRRAHLRHPIHCTPRHDQEVDGRGQGEGHQAVPRGLPARVPARCVVRGGRPRPVAGGVRLHGRGGGREGPHDQRLPRVRGPRRVQAHRAQHRGGRVHEARAQLRQRAQDLVRQLHLRPRSRTRPLHRRPEGAVPGVLHRRVLPQPQVRSPRGRPVRWRVPPQGRARAHQPGTGGLRVPGVPVRHRKDQRVDLQRPGQEHARGARREPQLGVPRRTHDLKKLSRASCTLWSWSNLKFACSFSKA